MFGLTKLILFSHFIVISVSAGVPKSLEFVDAPDLGPTVFFYYKQLPFIRYVSPLSPTKLLWENQSNMIALEYYPEEKTFFYTTSKGELYSVVWNKENDKSITEVYAEPRLRYSIKNNSKLLHAEKDWYPRSIALDEIGKKLYTADTIERSIDVFDLDGKSKARIFTSENVIPYEIVVDPTEGLLFFYGINFLKRKSELHRMNMDGSDHRVTIDTIDSIPHSALKVQVSLAIDIMDKQLYFKSGLNSASKFKLKKSNITVVDYNGHGRVPLVIDKPVALLEIKNHHLYWFDIIPKLDEEDFTDIKNCRVIFTFTSSSTNTNLSSCDLSNRVLINSSFYSCEPVLKYPYVIYSANTFKIIDDNPPQKRNNPCLEANNGCEDLCLLKSSGSDKKLSFGCACRHGRKLNSDEKTCSDLPKNDEKAVPYEKMGLLFSGSIGNFTNDNTDESPFLQISPMFFRKLADFKPGVAWDDALKVKYSLGKRGKDYKPKREEHVQEIRIIRNSTEKVAKVLAYDWVSKNLYYAKKSNDSDGKCDLFVMAKRYPEKEMFLGQIDKPTSMVAHPYRGYIFIAAYNKDEDKSRIIRLNTDGSNRLVFPYSNNTKIFLTLDMEEDKIYWIDGYKKKNSKNLWSSNLDGSDAKSTNIRFLRSAEFMTMYQEHIFLRTSRRKLYVFNKDGTEYNHFDVKDVGSTFDKMILTKLKVKKTNTQYLSQEDNPCVINNGGCETFCFAVSVNDSKKLQKVCDEKIA